MTEKQLILDEEKLLKIEQSIGYHNFIRLWLIKNHPETKIIDSDVQLTIDRFLTAAFTITPKGNEILESILGKEMSKTTSKIDVLSIYTAIQDKIESLLGKGVKQIRAQINGKTYSFVPSFTDFQTRLNKVVKKYKIEDQEKLKKVLLAYISSCKKENNYFPLLIYYIEKDNNSRLVGDYENFVEKVEKKEESNNGVFNL